MWHGALHAPAEPPLLPILPSQNQNLSNHQNIPEASLSLDHLHTIKRAPRPPIVSCSTVEEDNDSGGFDALDLDGRCPADVRRSKRGGLLGQVLTWGKASRTGGP